MTDFLGLFQTNEKHYSFSKLISHFNNDINYKMDSLKDDFLTSIYLGKQLFPGEILFSINNRYKAILIGSARMMPGKNYITDIPFYIINQLDNGNSLNKILSDIDGEFVCIIWDSINRIGYLAIDPVGHSNLYYSILPGQIFFSSHPKYISLLLGHMEIDKEALNLYFSLKCIPAPWSIIKNIKKLQPGHLIVFNSEGVNELDYWLLNQKTNQLLDISIEEAEYYLLNLLTKTIKRYIEDAQNTIGIFLSGGLDSTTVMAISKSLGVNLIAFSAGYVERTRTDERKFAKIAAKELNIPLIDIAISGNDVKALIENVLPKMPEPLADATFFPELFVGRQAKNSVQFILEGTGADTDFGGTNKYVAERFGNIYTNIPKFIRHNLILPISQCLPASRKWEITNFFRKWQFFIAGSELPLEDREIYWTSFMQQEQIKQILNTEWFIYENIGTKLLLNYLNEFSRQDISSVTYMNLKASLAWIELYKLGSIQQFSQLSIRSPFLSPPLIEFGFSLPDSYKFKGQHGKYILRNVVKDIIPKTIFNRSKANFSPPIYSWLKHELFDLFQDTIYQSNNYFNIKQILKFLHQNNIYWRDWQSELWAIFIFQYWWNSNKE